MAYENFLNFSELSTFLKKRYLVFLDKQNNKGHKMEKIVFTDSDIVECLVLVGEH